MAILQVSNLSFCYEGAFDHIFENVSFSVDTDWKLGLIGRNGKGKSTFLRLLMGGYEYQGSIQCNAVFDYFPYEVSHDDLELCGYELMERWKPMVESWRVLQEFPALALDSEVLYRPFGSLSFGERTKVMLAVLFSGENDFLLVDEPTNHLDVKARELIKAYLASKKGFILVSHDRDLLDGCIDHVLVLNRATIQVQSGNFSSWWENKEKADQFAKAENEKHLREIGKLRVASSRVSDWAIKGESSKIGYDPKKEPDRSAGTRPMIGAKSKKLMSRVKSMEHRIDREIQEKEGLLQDLEEVVDLKIMPLVHYKDLLVSFRDVQLSYPDAKSPVFSDLSFEIRRGDRVLLSGENGCGKSSIIKAILHRVGGFEQDFTGILTGEFSTAPNLVISYINQDTSHLSGSLMKYAKEHHLEYSLLLSLLRQLDFERDSFHKDMADFSEGQKKKVLIASSLMTPAHLYIWDEPLNYIDVFSRMQIEKLLDTFKPTMLLVEHDVRFGQFIATKSVMM